MHFIFALNTKVAHMNRSEWRKFYFIFSKDIKLISLSLLCNASYYLFRHINAVLFNKTFEGSQNDRIRRSTVCNDIISCVHLIFSPPPNAVFFLPFPLNFILINLEILLGYLLTQVK